MGSNATIPASGSFISRNLKDKNYFSSIHIVRVLSVDVPSGLIQVGAPVNDTLRMPLLGLSVPPDDSNNQQPNPKASSWGRYIPQVNDMILVAFATDGKPYAVGHSSISYNFMAAADAELEGEGGIGWGFVSGKTLKPGDWDFKASRGATLYLGDKATLGSSICSLTLSQNSQDLTLSAPLSIQKAGNSIIRYGSARRLVLPTDPSESFLYALSRPELAQEFTVDLRCNNLIPGGLSLAYFSMGDVIDELKKTVQVSNTGFPVRRSFSATDITGLIPYYTETVDAGGNYELGAPFAFSFKWTTPAAAWEVISLSTSITSSTTMNLTSIATMTLDSAIIKVGALAASPVVKGTELVAAFTKFSGIMTGFTTSATAPDPTGVTSGAAWAALAANLLILITDLTAALSKKVVVE